MEKVGFRIMYVNFCICQSEKTYKSYNPQKNISVNLSRQKFTS